VRRISRSSSVKTLVREPKSAVLALDAVEVDANQVVAEDDDNDDDDDDDDELGTEAVLVGVLLVETKAARSAGERGNATPVEEAVVEETTGVGNRTVGSTMEEDEDADVDVPSKASPSSQKASNAMASSIISDSIASAM